jgi:alpha-mannosidase
VNCFATTPRQPLQSAGIFLLSHAALWSALVIPHTCQAAEPPRQPTFWIIPHTHWEGAVFKTREEYLQMGLPNILKAVHLLKKYPNYRFVLDQVAYFKPFLERYPEAAADFRKFVAEGRLQIVGGLDIMPDVNQPGGETFIRQMQYGKTYCRQELGVDVTTGWLIDTFGHHAQMPQLLKLGGYKSFWFSRGVPKPNHPSEFLWEGIDGTRLNAFWLPYSYGLMWGSPRELAKFNAFATQRFNLLSPNSSEIDRVGLSGVDVSEPEEHLVPMIEAYNAQKDKPLTLRLAVPSDFENLVSKRQNLPVFKGELNPIFQGTYSSRIELKEWMRSAERLLTTAEKLGAIACWLGHTKDTAAVWRAWEPVLFNETHDLSSGVMTDHVYEDTLRSYAFSKRLADEIIDTKWNVLASKVDTRGKGTPLVVLNPLGWERTDVVESTIGFAESSVSGIVLQDDAGAAVPAQLLEASRYGNGDLKQVRFRFVARKVPSLGYCVYHAIPTSQANMGSDAKAPGNVLENESYRVTIDPVSGAIQSLLAKPENWEALKGPANVVARQQDRGDLWELNRGLDGGSKIAMTTKQPVPAALDALVSSKVNGRHGTVRAGPVFSEFTVSHPFGNGSLATAIRLYAGIRRIELSTSLVNNEKYVRYQVLFPTTIQNGKNVQAIPFGMIERPEGVEFPAQNWVDYSDGRHGVALLNIGLPGNALTDGTLMLSLLRSHTLGAYGFGGGYEPGMSSDTGLELGKVRTMHYAIVPHAGDWRQAGIFRAGMEFNNPLICRKASSHPGRLPQRWSFLEISDAKAVLSSLTLLDNGDLAVRLYEGTGTAASGVKLKFAAPVLSAKECNLLNDPGQTLRCDSNVVEFDMKPFEIKTCRIKLASGR